MHEVEIEWMLLMSLTACNVYNVKQFGKYVKSIERNCCLHRTASLEVVRYSEHSLHCCTFCFKQFFKLAVSLSVLSQCIHDEIRQAMDYNATSRRVRASIFAVEKR